MNSDVEKNLLHKAQELLGEGRADEMREDLHKMAAEIADLERYTVSFEDEP
jgi:hypothetical protein